MTKERRKEDHVEGDKALGHMSKNKRRVKSRAKSKSKKTASASFSLKSHLSKFSQELKTKPQKTIKKLLFKAGIYFWSIAVVLSLMSLMGFPISSMFLSTAETTAPGQKVTSSNSRVLRASDDFSPDLEVDNQGGFWKSFSSNLFPSNGLLSDGGDVVSKQDLLSPDSVEDDDDDSESDLDEVSLIPQQMLPSTPKQGNKLNKKLEKGLACDEEDCISTCNTKIKAKCARSSSCRKERERVCKRRCRKQRCEERCKDEPKFGYVEREQRMEKCKDDCSGPTAVHNKCIKKCHSQFKPCKSRCHEIASKFICDRMPEPSVTMQAVEREEKIGFVNMDLLGDPEII